MGSSNRVGLGYQRALDGWRGVGVLMVMLYHADGRDLVPGAFMWIDGFFTLSAFLITTLLLEEHARADRIDLGGFWARRVRRLAPALMLTLAGMGLFGLIADRTQRAALNGDVLATLFYVANWRSVLAGSDYFAAYGAESPLKHTWSLAIEEQFYLLFPLLLLAVYALCRRWRRDPEISLGVVAGVGALASSLWMMWLYATGSSISRLYYGTDTRAQALLIGVVLAVIWRRRPVLEGSAAATALRVVGVAFFVVLFFAQFLVHEDSTFLYRGGFGLIGVAQAVVFAALLLPSRFRDALAWRPLVWVGAMAYGLYLFHFPLFAWLSAERTGLDGPALLALRFGVTFAIAVPVFRLVEQPIRHKRWPKPHTVAAWLAWPAAIVVVTAVAIGAGSPPATPDRDELVAMVTTTTAEATPGDPSGTTAATQPMAPPRIAVVGDSTGTRLALGVDAWAQGTGQAVWAGDGARVGCPLGRGGEIHTAADAIGPVLPLCDWSTTAADGLDGAERPTYATITTDWRPDLVVASFGPWDVSDRRIPGDPTWRHAGDPVYDAWLLGEMQAATDTLAANGATVVWLTQPPWEGATRHPPEHLYAPAADPARMTAFNDLLRQLAESRPDTVRVVDVAAWISATGDDARLRPDGAHLEPETAVEVMNRFLGAELLAAAADVGTGGIPRPGSTLEP